MMRVNGKCPMGCGETLYIVGDENLVEIICTYKDCPDPWAVTKLIHEPAIHHTVEFTEDDYTIEHPLRERIGKTLFDCHLKFDQPPDGGVGRYRAYRDVAEGSYYLVPLDVQK